MACHICGPLSVDKFVIVIAIGANCSPNTVLDINLVEYFLESFCDLGRKLIDGGQNVTFMKAFV
jgi:hypothetical protein